MNPSLIKFIPNNCKRILEIGCSDGELGEFILKNGICEEFIGIELLEDKTQIASTKISRVIVGDAEKLDSELLNIGEVDCLIYGDSLEHMKDPLSVLSNYLKILKNDGCVIASIPNIRNLFIIEQLIRGRWIYTDWGLLDQTHYHLFTLHELKLLFTEVGLRIGTINSSFRSGHWFTQMHKSVDLDFKFLELYDSLQSTIPNDINLVKSVLNQRYSMENLSDSDVMELFTVQFHLVAIRN